MILYHAADLLWATRIKGTADALGIPCRPVRNTDMLRARLAEGGVRALLVDLDAPEAAMELVRWVRRAEATEAERGVRVLAYGPHVLAERFAEAKAAGADTLMARGALAARLGEVLGRLAADDGVQSALEE